MSFISIKTLYQEIRCMLSISRWNAKKVASVELTKQKKKNQALLSIITANNTTLLMVIIKIEHSNKIPHTDF